MHSTHKYALGVSALVLASALALSGCSGSGTGSDMTGMNHGSMPMTQAPPSAGAKTTAAFNDADVMFAQMMVPHHQQAVEMSDTLLGKSGIDPKVTALAEKIKAAQQPEIDQLTSWLAAWGQPAPTSTAMHDMSGMSGMSGGDGMMSGDDMAKLHSADGAAASKLFLSQMIAHHEGAVAMAKTEAGSGSDAKAVAMAKSIVGSQTAEITQMKALLASL